MTRDGFRLDTEPFENGQDRKTDGTDRRLGDLRRPQFRFLPIAGVR